MSSILVVDDEPAIQRAISTAFTARGYEVGTAATGEQALASLAAHPVDLVILDLGLPDLDGVEVCRRLLRAQPAAGRPAAFARRRP